MTDRYTIHTGDCLDVLRTLPSESVHCCVTSPPYFGLRDYGVGGQIGLEDSPDAWAERLVCVFREIRRVLRGDGTLWVNCGDSYCSQPSGSFGKGGRPGNGGAYRSNTYLNGRIEGVKTKDLIGLPWMLAFALRADGWYLRSDIIWHKPNPMPESVTDRPTKAHEYLFLLSKKASYYYDSEAVREGGSGRCPGNKTYKYDGLNGHETKQGILAQSDIPQIVRNKRTVWTIATQSYADAHFATYPEDLVTPCVLAATSEKGVCPTCGAGWRREVETLMGDGKGQAYDRHRPDGMIFTGRERNSVRTQLGWTPACTCPHTEEDLLPAVVLDPFAGSGTTLLVAMRYGRRGVGIELNPQYVEMAHRRLAGTAAQGLLL